MKAVAAYVGTDLCKGIVLLNSAGPLLSQQDWAERLEEEGGTVLSRMKKGFGTKAGLPEYSPPPQWLLDFGAGVLFGILQPYITPILKSLYPSNQNPVQDCASVILRDSRDPFAVNVIASFSRLGPNRSSNELFDEYAAGNGGRLLVCQGMADKLGGGPDNQPVRLRLFEAAARGLQFQAVPLEGCGHCPHHEAPGAVAAAVRAWLMKQN